MTLPTFLHSPRTGGTAIAKALGYGDRGEQHRPARYHRELDRPWTIVRNPYDRAVSLAAFLFRWRLEQGQRELAPSEFWEWLANDRRDAAGRVPMLYQGLEHETPVYAPQLVFCGHWMRPDPLLGVRVFRFESLERDWPAICDYVGVPIQAYPAWMSASRSRRGSWRFYYTEETKRVVRRLYAHDFAAFEYGE